MPPSWFSSLERYATNGERWCGSGIGHPGAGGCVINAQDGACRRHDFCAIHQDHGPGKAIACACDRSLYLASDGFIEHTLYGPANGEAWLYVTAGVVVAVAGLLATWLPGRRAASVDPLVALRSE